MIGINWPDNKPEDNGALEQLTMEKNGMGILGDFQMLSRNDCFMRFFIDH